MNSATPTTLGSIIAWTALESFLTSYEHYSASGMRVHLQYRVGKLVWYTGASGRLKV